MNLPSTCIHLSFGLLAGTAGFAYFRNKGNTMAEASAYGLMAMLMVQSWSAQVAVAAGLQRFHHFSLALIGIPAIRIIQRHWGILKTLWQPALGFIRNHKLVAAGLAAGVMILAALHIHTGLDRTDMLSALRPAARAATGTDANLARDAALIVMNHAVFAAPWQPKAAVGIANLSAWMIIALSTYALARRCAWPATAATVALLVVCMPRVVQQSLALHSELLPAAAVLVALLALYRAVEQPCAQDIVMLSAAIGFSVSGGRLCYLMPVVLTGLSVMVLRRRHAVRRWPAALAVHFRASLAALCALAVFSQAGNVALNLTRGKAWIGTPPVEAVAFNMDGLFGALANTGRYAAQSVDFPEFVDRLVPKVLGISPKGVVESAYRGTFDAVLDGKGAATAFALSWSPGNPWGWFGPAGFLLILPALAYALWRAPRRLKNTAAAMLAYFLAIALILAWQPRNVRQLTMFFVGSGFLVAFFLPPWRISRRGRLVLQLYSILMASYTLIA